MDTRMLGMSTPSFATYLAGLSFGKNLAYSSSKAAKSAGFVSSTPHVDDVISGCSRCAQDVLAVRQSLRGLLLDGQTGAFTRAGVDAAHAGHEDLCTDLDALTVKGRTRCGRRADDLSCHPWFSALSIQTPNGSHDWTMRVTRESAAVRQPRASTDTVRQCWRWPARGRRCS